MLQVICIIRGSVDSLRLSSPPSSWVCMLCSISNVRSPKNKTNTYQIPIDLHEHQAYMLNAHKRNWYVDQVSVFFRLRTFSGFFLWFLENKFNRINILNRNPYFRCYNSYISYNYIQTGSMTVYMQPCVKKDVVCANNKNIQLCIYIGL